MEEPSRRHRQVANAIREELVIIFRKDISDPRLEAAGMITVSGVEVTEDMRNANVFVSFMGKEEKSKKVKEALSALKSAEKFIHRLLIKRIAMKVHPRLNFKYDKIFEQAAVISGALSEAAVLEKETAAYRAEHGINPDDADASYKSEPEEDDDKDESDDT